MESDHPERPNSCTERSNRMDDSGTKEHCSDSDERSEAPPQMLTQLKLTQPDDERQEDICCSRKTAAAESYSSVDGRFCTTVCYTRLLEGGKATSIDDAFIQNSFPGAVDDDEDFKIGSSPKMETGMKFPTDDAVHFNDDTDFVSRDNSTLVQRNENALYNLEKTREEFPYAQCQETEKLWRIPESDETVVHESNNLTLGNSPTVAERMESEICAEEQAEFTTARYGMTKIIRPGDNLISSYGEDNANNTGDNNVESKSDQERSLECVGEDSLQLLPNILTTLQSNVDLHGECIAAGGTDDVGRCRVRIEENQSQSPICMHIDCKGIEYTTGHLKILSRGFHLPRNELKTTVSSSQGLNDRVILDDVLTKISDQNDKSTTVDGSNYRQYGGLIECTNLVEAQASDLIGKTVTNKGAREIVPEVFQERQSMEHDRFEKDGKSEAEIFENTVQYDANQTFGDDKTIGDVVNVSIRNDNFQFDDELVGKIGKTKENHTAVDDNFLTEFTKQRNASCTDFKSADDSESGTVTDGDKHLVNINIERFDCTHKGETQSGGEFSSKLEDELELECGTTSKFHQKFEFETEDDDHNRAECVNEGLTVILDEPEHETVIAGKVYENSQAKTGSIVLSECKNEESTEDLDAKAEQKLEICLQPEFTGEVSAISKFEDGINARISKNSDHESRFEKECDNVEVSEKKLNLKKEETEGIHCRLKVEEMLLNEKSFSLNFQNDEITEVPHNSELETATDGKMCDPLESKLNHSTEIPVEANSADITTTLKCRASEFEIKPIICNNSVNKFHDVIKAETLENVASSDLIPGNFNAELDAECEDDGKSQPREEDETEMTPDPVIRLIATAAVDRICANRVDDCAEILENIDHTGFKIDGDSKCEFSKNGEGSPTFNAPSADKKDGGISTMDESFFNDFEGECVCKKVQIDAVASFGCTYALGIEPRVRSKSGDQENVVQKISCDTEGDSGRMEEETGAVGSPGGKGEVRTGVVDTVGTSLDRGSEVESVRQETFIKCGVADQETVCSIQNITDNDSDLDTSETMKSLELPGDGDDTQNLSREVEFLPQGATNDELPLPDLHLDNVILHNEGKELLLSTALLAIEHSEIECNKAVTGVKVPCNLLTFDRPSVVCEEYVESIFEETRIDGKTAELAASAYLCKPFIEECGTTCPEDEFLKERLLKYSSFDCAQTVPERTPEARCFDWTDPCCENPFGSYRDSALEVSSESVGAIDEQHVVPSGEHLMQEIRGDRCSYISTHLEETLYEAPPEKRLCLEKGVEFDTCEFVECSEKRNDLTAGKMSTINHDLKMFGVAKPKRIPLYKWKSESGNTPTKDESYEQSYALNSNTSDPLVPAVVKPQKGVCHRPLRLGLSKRQHPPRLHPNYANSGRGGGGGGGR